MAIFQRIVLFLQIWLHVSTWNCDAFVVLQRTPTIHSVGCSERKSGQGFGKTTAQEDRPTPRSESIPQQQSPVREEGRDSSSSVNVKPDTAVAESATEDMRSPEERAAQVLREKYGLRSLGEQQVDVQQRTREKEEQTKWATLQKKAAAKEENFDLFRVLPAPVLKGIDFVLKAGTAVCTVLFVSAGLLVTVEAWGKATGQELPPELDQFIVQTVEPNFTPGLLVLLSFSVSLGIFAALQLGSQGASYRED
jgi:hypothetical protein